MLNLRLTPAENQAVTEIVDEVKRREDEINKELAEVTNDKLAR